jgi:hypothetical protein
MGRERETTAGGGEQETRAGGERQLQVVIDGGKKRRIATVVNKLVDLWCGRVLTYGM